MLYLIAGSGAPNFGDELIVQNWLRFYREAGYDGPITVDGKGATATSRLLREFRNVEFVKTNIPRHRDGMEGSYTDFFNVGIEFAHDNISRFRGVKAFHFLGGGYTGAHWRNVMRLLGGATELAAMLNVPVIGTGLGVEPFLDMSAEDRRVWSYIVARFALLECRDAASFSRLSDLTDGRCWGLSLGLDDAYLSPVRATSHSGRWLHLSGFSEEGIFGPKGREVLNSLAGQFDEVAFWVCAKSDNKVYESLVETHPFVRRISNFDLLRKGLPLSPSDFMLTARFHPHLMAARVGMSGYYTVGSAFYGNKHGLVSELGSTFRRIGSGPVTTFSEVPHRMLQAEQGRVEEKHRVAQRILSLLRL